MSVEPGQKAPDFSLPTDGNGKVTLSELAGNKVVLYFYPKDDTSGCTAEACGFRDSFPDYGGAGAVVIGISKDFGRLARQVQEKARSAVYPRLGHRGRGLREVRDVGRKEHVRAQIHGDRPQHVSDRRRGHGSRRVAQGAGAGPCRRGAEGGAGPLIANLEQCGPSIAHSSSPLRKLGPRATGRRSPLGSRLRGKDDLLRRGNLFQAVVEDLGATRSSFTKTPAG